MTIPSTPRRAGPYVGNGATTIFSFSFKTLAAAEITVVRQNADGTRTTLANPADYSVSLNSNQNTSPGGSITAVTAPATGTTITIASNVPFSQEVDIQNQSGFYPDVVELGLDRLAAQAQQLSEITTRGLRAPVTDSTSVDLTLPPVALRASKSLAFDAAGAPIAGDSTPIYIPTLPSQTGNANKVLITDGSAVSWDTVGTANLTNFSVTTGKLANDAVTLAKIQHVPTGTILGRSTVGAGSLEGLTLGAGLSASGGSLSAVDATDTAKGIVELATTAETRTGTDTARAITPAGLKASIGFSYRYESAATTITATSGGAFTHGLGGRPTLYQTVLQCVTTDAGYAVGAELLLGGTDGSGNNSTGISTWGDTTSVSYRVGASIQTNHASTGVQTSLTLANWRLVIRCWI